MNTDPHISVNTGAVRGLAAWHDYMTKGGDPQALRAQLAEDVVFHSPVVHTPQVGRDKVFSYLHAASLVLGGDSFTYVRQLVDGSEACLEFTCIVDDIQINGVDIIRWNDDNLISDFKVMVRPLKAINKVWDKMAEMLKAQTA